MQMFSRHGTCWMPRGTCWIADVNFLRYSLTTHMPLKNRINITHGKEINSKMVYRSFLPHATACTCWKATRSGVTVVMHRSWRGCMIQPGRASSEVFPKRCSTFPDLHTFLRETRKVSQHRKLWVPFWVAVKSTSTWRDTGGLCDGQLRVWNTCHLITWKRWPTTASKQTVPFTCRMTYFKMENTVRLL